MSESIRAESWITVVSIEKSAQNKSRSLMLRLLQIPGRYLLSHGAAPILPSAQGGLTAGFGMEPGVSRPSIGTRGNLKDHWKLHRGFRRSRPRPISTGGLNASQRLHPRPIKVLFSDRPYSLNGMGGLILGCASRLDAFSGYRLGA